MSDSIEIKIRSTFESGGTQAASKAVADLAKAIAAVAGGKPPNLNYDQVAGQAQTAATAVGNLSKEEIKAAKTADQLATSQARAGAAVASKAAAEARAETATLRLAAAQEKANSAAQQGGSYFDKMGASITSSFMGIVGPAAIAGTAIAAIKKAGDLAMVGEQAGKVEASFNQLAATAGTTGDALLGALRKASGGEISDLNLQLAANKANLLGVADSAQEMGVLMDIARDRAQKMGISTTQAFDNLVTGLGRGSALILDNLGIMVKESEVYDTYAKSVGKSASALTDAEKKQALINAVIAQGQGSLADAAGNADVAANAMTQLGVAAENTTTRIGSLINNALQPVAKAVTDMLNASNEAAAGIAENGTAAVQSSQNYTQYIARIRELNQEYQKDAGRPVLQAMTEAQFNYAKSLEATGMSTADAQAKAAAMNGTLVSIGDVQKMAAAQGTASSQAIDQLSNSMLRVAETGTGGSAAVESLTMAYLMGGVSAAQFQAALDALIARENDGISTSERAAGVTMKAADANERKAASTTNAAAADITSAAAMQQVAATSIQATAAKDAQTAATALLDFQTRSAAEAFMALNPGIDGSGVASAVAAGKISAAVGQYIAMTLAAAQARAQLAQLQAQAGMAPAVKAAVAANPGDVGRYIGTQADPKAKADGEANAARYRQVRQQRQEQQAAARSLAMAKATAEQKRGILQQEYNDAVRIHGATSTEAIKAETALVQAQETGGRARTASAGKAATARQAVEDASGAKLAKIVSDAQEKILAIEQRVAEQRAAAARKLQNELAQSAADRRASNEADDLDLIGVKDAKEAARLNDRERAQADAREREKAAAAEARASIAAGEAETGEKVYAARQQQIQDQQALDEAYYAKQRELAGDPAALEALRQQYEEGTRAIAEATDQRIAFAQAEAAEKSAAVQAEKAAVIAAAEEQAASVSAASERSSSAVKAAMASARASAVSDLQAIGAAVDAIPTSKTVTVNVQRSGDAGGAGADGAYAGGGTFVTRGPTNITVGDNPGGAELVSVIPLSGTGTTRAAPGTIALAGGGNVLIDAGDGYSTPVAGTGGSGGKKGKGGKGTPSPAEIKDRIAEQKELVALLSDLLKLRHDMAEELKNGTPFDVGFAQRLAHTGAVLAGYVRDALPKVTKDEAEGYKRAAEFSRDGVSWLSDLIALRKDMSDYKDVNPFDIAFIERLINTGKRIAALVQASLIPVTESQVDQMQRWADLNGAVVSLIKDVAGLNAQMFSDYVPPSDAQLNQIVRDANRIARRLVEVAKTYDTKGLEGAKAFTEAVGGTFTAFKDGLLFFQALNSGDFMPKAANLAKFEKATAQTMGVAARLGAMAKKIPAQDIAALQLTTQALAGQAEALIKLAAVPFADLPAAAKALQLQSNVLLGGSRAGAGGGNTYITINPPPGMNPNQIADLVIQKLGKKAQARQ